MSRSPLANWLGFIRRHTNTMACTSPGDQMSLTQTLTHFPQNRPGTERADLRVLGHFRSKKARKVLRRSGWRDPPQLITRRSLVQVQPPQPYCATKIDTHRKALEPQRLWGFFVLKFRCEFYRCTLLNSLNGEDMNLGKEGLHFVSLVFICRMATNTQALNVKFL